MRPGDPRHKFAVAAAIAASMLGTISAGASSSATSPTRKTSLTSLFSSKPSASRARIRKRYDPQGLRGAVSGTATLIRHCGVVVRGSDRFFFTASLQV